MSDDERIQRLVDEAEVRNLLTRIHNCVDAIGRGEQTEDDYFSNWTDDGVWESPTFGTFVGREGHRQRHEAAHDRSDRQRPDLSVDVSETLHMTVNTDIELAGDEAICHSKILFGATRGKYGDVYRMGRYRDRVVRTPAGWRLQHRIVYP